LAAASVAPQAKIGVTAPDLPANSLKVISSPSHARASSVTPPQAPAQFQRDVESELNMWAGVIAKAGIKPQ